MNTALPFPLLLGCFQFRAGVTEVHLFVQQIFTEGPCVPRQCSRCLGRRQRLGSALVGICGITPPHPVGTCESEGDKRPTEHRVKRDRRAGAGDGECWRVRVEGSSARQCGHSTETSFTKGQSIETTSEWSFFLITKVISNRWLLQEITHTQNMH